MVVLLFAVITWQANGQYNFLASMDEGCTPLKVKFSFVSSATVDSISACAWDFGNGQTSTLQNPDSVTYNTGGSFDVTLQLTYSSGGSGWITKSDMITAHRTVPANFVYYDTISYNVYVFKHQAPLDTGVSYTFTWDIESFSPRTGPRQVITFPSLDTFTVSLTVADDQGCTSTRARNVYVLEDITVQNFFTPNDDGNNDYFIISSNGGFPIRVRIFTRAGILVFQGEGTTIAWPGTSASGVKMNDGVYFYAIEALAGDPNNRYSKSGFLYLYR